MATHEKWHAILPNSASMKSSDWVMILSFALIVLSSGLKWIYNSGLLGRIRLMLNIWRVLREGAKRARW